MRSFLVVAIVTLSAAGAAQAKPLPAGMTLSIKSNHVAVTDGGVQVVLDDVSLDKLGKVELSDDGTTIKVPASEMCNGSPGDVIEISLAKVQAKLENVRGMTAHLKKKYADAIPHFAAAVKLDPTLPVYATNLLSAQSLGGKLADADQTLATAAPRNVPWFVWRLLVDSDLTPLAGRPSTKLVTIKRGTATSKALGEQVAYSPLGLVATEISTNIWDGIPDGSGTYAISIVDIKTNTELLRLPTETKCAVDMDAAMKGVNPPPPADKKCAAREAALAKTLRSSADAVLEPLGFNVVPKQKQSLVDDKGQALTQVVGLDGKKHDVPDTVDGRPFYAGFVPGAAVVWYRTGKHIDACGADGPYDMALAVFPTK